MRADDGDAEPACVGPDVVAQEAQADLDDCDAAYSQAEDCCNGQACSGGGVFGGGGGGGNLLQVMLTVSVSTLLSRYSDDPTSMQSMSSLCNSYGGLGGQGGSYNNNLVSACNSQKRNCTNHCQAVARDWAARAKAAGESCPGYDAMYKLASQLRRRLRDCDDFRPNPSLSAQANNMNGVNQNAMRDVCSQLARQQPQYFQVIPLQAQQQGVDCSNPVNTNSSLCSPCVQNPNAPGCIKASTDTSTGAAFVEGANHGSGPGDFNTASLDSKATQATPIAPSTAANNASGAGNRPLGGAGSSNIIGSASNSSGASGDARAQRGQGPGFNTAVLLGERSGGGAPGGSDLGTADTSTGFAGYGNGPSNDRATASVDLKRYLPGQPNYKRAVAGVGSAHPDINARGVDIFDRLSQRYRLVCYENRLKDCKFLRKTVP